MPKVIFSLPRLLEPAVGPTRRVELEAESIGEAIDRLLDRHPTLRVHLFDEEAGLRQHVLCFVNGSQTRLVDRSQSIDEGAEITFLQAVSGG
jgi:molybdopterin synthase sulfur carrier subunit